jgi:small GTP-binding protein
MTEIKIVLVGPSGSGKTKFFNILTQNSEVPKPTAGPVFMVRQIDIKGKMFNVKLVDTSGQERFKNLTRGFLNRVNGVFCVFDLTNNESFEKAKEMVS